MKRHPPGCAELMRNGDTAHQIIERRFLYCFFLIICQFGPSEKNRPYPLTACRFHQFHAFRMILLPSCPSLVSLYSRLEERFLYSSPLQQFLTAELSSMPPPMGKRVTGFSVAFGPLQHGYQRLTTICTSLRSFATAVTDSR